MTQSEEFLAIMKWGGGQPETVKDYRVELLRAGQWTSALQEKGNWQRLRIHHLSGEAGENISAMRLVVESAWGIDQARVVSVRVY
jgi:hypothetical protein